MFFFKRCTFSLLTFFALFCLAYVPTVLAFRVTPAIVEVDVAPGNVAQGTLQITNTSNEARTYYVSTQNFVTKGEEGQQDFLSQQVANGLAAWLVPAADAVTLKPQESISFAYSIKVPLEAAPGGHYAALFFSDRLNTNADQASVGVGAKVGVVFLARVSGFITEAAQVETFRVENGDRLTRLPAFFELRIRNLGNVHIRPEGEVKITNMLGMTAASIPINPQKAAVLPSSVRRLETDWHKDSDLWNNFAFGRYTARVEATYGTTRQPLEASVTFWIVPWQLTLSVIIGLLSISLLIRSYNRLIIRSAAQKKLSS